MSDSPSTQVFCRVTLWFSVISFSWLFMQVVHEFGHISGAWITGGTIVLIDLHPLHISHTLVSPNPHPVIVIWAGPIMGVLLPLFFYLACRRFFPNQTHIVRFFAGFCFIANGAYLGSSAIDAVGDAKDLMIANVPIYLTIAFATLTIPSGFLLWNRQGASFGIGKNGRVISLREAGTAVSTLLICLIATSILFPITFAQ